MPKPMNLLDFLPSASALRHRLLAIEKEKQQLEVVLKTAEEVEAINRSLNEHRDDFQQQPDEVSEFITRKRKEN